MDLEILVHLQCLLEGHPAQREFVESLGPSLTRNVRYCPKSLRGFPRNKARSKDRRINRTVRGTFVGHNVA